MNLSLPDDSRMRSPGFVYGVATSAFQIEGAAAERLPSIWDTFCAEEGRIQDCSNGDVACDHVNRYREDIDIMHGLGVDAYRFSIAWPRVIREDGGLNNGGLDFYKRLLDGLNENEISAFATLYHWDLPQYLGDEGGWLNRDMAYRFRDYVDLVSRELDGVQSWATLNEPFCSAWYGYAEGIHAPGLRDPALARKAAHHLLLGHGLAMPVLQANCPDASNGIVLNFTPTYPASGSEGDHHAADLADQLHNRWYSDPVLKGEYPEMLNGLPKDQRPDILDGDLDIISAPMDCLGINYYSRGVFRSTGNGSFTQVEQTENPSTQMGWEVYPAGLTDLLIRLDQRYELPPVFITENGAAYEDVVENGVCHDDVRVAYLQSHLEALDQAMRSGVDVRGYFAWSLMDNFEWAYGLTRRFGLVHVDFETQCRTLKTSAHAYRELIRGRKREAA